MKAYIFPGQGSQFPGMGKELYEANPVARDYFDKANELLGFDITSIMFSGTADELKQTRVTQPAIFIHSVALALSGETFNPDMVAGHSLGEFSALVAARVLTYEDGLRLVARRAEAMQRACDMNPSSMAAVLGLDDKVVEDICASIDDVVVPANYNSPGQLVISGTTSGVTRAGEKLKAAGAKRVVMLPVGGAFHSPLMEPARQELADAIAATAFSTPLCPVYQNVNALPSVREDDIRKNLIEQLTAPVRWTQSVQNMVKDGARQFYECGPGKVLQGLVRKIAPEVETGDFSLSPQ
ncbi:MAG: ACP S-malonyltransferase [Cyclobacteriaceae bacterium]|nr:ACP S-malonyltransferase [Cyclobacteriaceae bacterium]